jgi:hypothetical protein
MLWDGMGICDFGKVAVAVPASGHGAGKRFRPDATPQFDAAEAIEELLISDAPEAGADKSRDRGATSIELSCSHPAPQTNRMI